MRYSKAVAVTMGKHSSQKTEAVKLIVRQYNQNRKFRIKRQDEVAPDMAWCTSRPPDSSFLRYVFRPPPKQMCFQTSIEQTKICLSKDLAGCTTGGRFSRNSSSLRTSAADDLVVVKQWSTGQTILNHVRSLCVEF